MAGGAAECMTACHALVRKSAVANAASANFEVTPVDVINHFNFCIIIIIIINY